MAYGLALIAGTLMGFAGVATLTVKDHPPAPRVPTELASDNRDTLSPSLEQREATRSLVRLAPVHVFADRQYVSSANRGAVSQNISAETAFAPPDAAQAQSGVSLPVGRNVEVRFIQRTSANTGEIVAMSGRLISSDTDWIHLRSDKGANCFIARGNVAFIIEAADAK